MFLMMPRRTRTKRMQVTSSRAAKAVMPMREPPLAGEAGSRPARRRPLTTGLYSSRIKALLRPAFSRLKGRNTGISIPAMSEREVPVM